MKARPKSARSKFQINFQTKQTFHRNKHLFSNPITNSKQKQQSILRRKPLQASDNHISEKINSSFINTTAQLTQRTQGKLHKKRSSSLQFPLTIYSNQSIQENSPIRQKRCRSFSMQKMTSRQYHHKLKNKIIADQRRFNNFQKFQPSTPLNCNYDKMMTYQQEKQKSTLNLEYNTQKLYEQYYYKSTTTNCKVDYNSQKQLKSQRYFFIPKRSQNQPSTQLDIQKIDQGLKLATHYKSNNINKTNISQFYRNSGRDLPSQSDMRYMNQLTNYWKDQSGKIKQNGLNYQYENKKMKEDMLNKRISNMHMKKQKKIQKNQMCEQKYFRRCKL